MEKILTDIDIRVEGNPILRVFTRNLEQCADSIIRIGRSDVTEITNEKNEKAIISKSRIKHLYDNHETVFLNGKSGIRCIATPLLDGSNKINCIKTIQESWQFTDTLTSQSSALRDAQKGALCSIFSHWTCGNSPATVVMPTGTGKTETLLATIAASSPKCTLVIVPTDSLRTQFFQKALTWGCLNDLGVLGDSTKYPLVGMLRSGFKDNNNFTRFLKSCHIIVATMPILSKMHANQLESICDCCELVAVDEAHHLGAPSWSRVVDSFKDINLLQFTATPFRQDGKHIGGEIIYSFPLAKCQSQGYFKPIEFIPITEYQESSADKAILNAAVKRLRNDIDSGLEHALMARTVTKKRARIIYEMYCEFCPDLNPVMIYSGMRTPEKDAAKKKLLEGQSKVIVCVDMLGEGFDYPNLKVAAIHDPHKSLPITLQFIGRFTRSGSQAIGNASVVANIADPKMQQNVSSLYSQDADWDVIIRGSYEDAVGHEVEFQKFINSFIFDGIKGFSLRNIHPKFSSFVYSVSGEIDFESLKGQYNDGEEYRLALNLSDNIAVIIQKENRKVEWGKIAELENTNYHCTCIYHDIANNLLFIHSSGKEIPDAFASTVSDNAVRIKDNRIHRCMHGINRLMLSNVGLRKRLVGPIRYRQYMGLDVGQGLRERITENTYTAMLFGMGYENAQKTSVGCSLKGKVWSRDAGRLLDWESWCSEVGKKIVDDSINVNHILDGVLYPESITEFDQGRTVVAVDWPDYFFGHMFDRSSVSFQNEVNDLDDYSIVISGGIQSEHTLEFAVVYNDIKIAYLLRLTESVPEGFTISCVSDDDCVVQIGSKTRTGVEFFSENPPMFWMDDSSVIADGCLRIHASLNQQSCGYNPSNANIRDWQGINIRVESQGESKRSDSIQRAIIEEAIEQSPLFVFDDDGSGEVADVVAVFEQDDTILVRLYHCKYSTEDNPGLRVNEIYELCGQAQKSVKWAGSYKKLIGHLKRRDICRKEKNKPSRFELGGLRELVTFATIARQKQIKYEVVLVQPGISKASLTAQKDRAGNVLRILGATQAYLAETFEIEMHLIISQ